MRCVFLGLNGAGELTRWCGTFDVAALALIEKPTSDHGSQTAVEPIVCRLNTGPANLTTFMHTGTGEQGTMLASIMLEELERARAWLLEPRPNLVPLPRDSVAAVHADDEKRSIPFVQIFARRGGRGMPRVQYYTVDDEGGLEMANCADGFERFEVAPFFDQRADAMRRVAATTMAPMIGAALQSGRSEAVRAAQVGLETMLRMVSSA